jgi:hypothetical protein
VLHRPHARLLGLVKRDVGAPQQLDQADRAGRGDHDTRRHLGREGHAFDFDRAGQLHGQAARPAHGHGGGGLEAFAALAREVGHEQRELITAEPGDQFVRSDVGCESTRRDLKQLVAGQVTQGVIDDLEIVQVEEEQRHRARRRAGREDRLAALKQRVAIGQAGQRVVR